MTTVLVLLGAALCSMCLAIDIEETDRSYFVAFATPEPWLKSAKAKNRMGAITWEMSKDGDLDVKFTSRNSDGTCMAITVSGKKTEDPKKFTYTKKGKTAIDTFQILDVASTEYGLVLFHSNKGGQIVPTIRLFAHTQTASEEAKNEMKTRCDQFGIPRGNIVYLPKNDGC